MVGGKGRRSVRGVTGPARLARESNSCEVPIPCLRSSRAALRSGRGAPSVSSETRPPPTIVASLSSTTCVMPALSVRTVRTYSENIAGSHAIPRAICHEKVERNVLPVPAPRLELHVLFRSVVDSPGVRESLDDSLRDQRSETLHIPLLRRGHGREWGFCLQTVTAHRRTSNTYARATPPASIGRAKTADDAPHRELLHDREIGIRRPINKLLLLFHIETSKGFRQMPPQMSTLRARDCEAERGICLRGRLLRHLLRQSHIK